MLRNHTRRKDPTRANERAETQIESRDRWANKKMCKFICLMAIITVYRAIFELYLRYYLLAYRVASRSVQEPLMVLQICL